MPVQHKCQTCSKLFTRSTTLRDHTRSHNEDREHKCNVCGRAFVRNSDRKDHEKTHTQEHKYLCRRRSENGSVLGCSAGFHRKSDLHRHWKRAAAGAKCQIESRTFATEDMQAFDAAEALFDLASTNDHPSADTERRKSPSPRSPIRTELRPSTLQQDATNEPFTSSTTYQLQVADADNDEWSAPAYNLSPLPLPSLLFSCYLCPGKFSRAYNLQSHLRTTHSDEHPFVCEVCGKAFARQLDRRRHERLHSLPKKFVCRGELVYEPGKSWGCGSRFTGADALDRHFQSEEGRKCVQPLLDETKKLEHEKKRLQDGNKWLEDGLKRMRDENEKWNEENKMMEDRRKWLDDEETRLNNEEAARLLLENPFRQELEIYRFEEEDIDNEVVDALKAGTSDRFPLWANLVV